MKRVSAWVSLWLCSVSRLVLPSPSCSPGGPLPSAESWEDPSSSRQCPHQLSSSSGCSTSPSPPWRPTESSSPASKKYRTRKNFYKVPFTTTTTKTDSQLLSSNKKLLISPSPASSSGHLVVIKNSIEAQTNKLWETPPTSRACWR